MVKVNSRTKWRLWRQEIENEKLRSIDHNNNNNFSSAIPREELDCFFNPPPQQNDAWHFPHFPRLPFLQNRSKYFLPRREFSLRNKIIKLSPNCGTYCVCTAVEMLSFCNEGVKDISHQMPLVQILEFVSHADSVSPLIWIRSSKHFPQFLVRAERRRKTI